MPGFQAYEVLVHDLKELDADEQHAQEYPKPQEFRFYHFFSSLNRRSQSIGLKAVVDKWLK